VNWQTTVYPLIKDIVITGTGVTIVWVQALSPHPSGLALGTGLAFALPSVADHVRALLPSSGGGGSSSLPQPPPSELPSVRSSPEG
jgi:hypothetical protein